MKKLELKNNTRKVEFTGDPIGKVCIVDGQVFRIVNGEKEEFVKELFSCGLIQELVDGKMLVNTWINEDVCFDQYNLVIEHEKIENWNYPYEWSYAMLKDAAKVVIAANKVCNKYGYELFDVHPYNVVYRFATPMYVDLGSIVKRDTKNGESWGGYELFKTFFITPLSLFSKGYVDLSTALLLHNSPMEGYDLFKLRHPVFSQFGILSKKVAKFSQGFTKLSIVSYDKLEDRYGKHPKYKWLLKAKNLGKNIFTIKRAERRLNGLSRPRFSTYWGDYHDTLNLETTDRFKRLLAIIDIQMKDADSLVEIGSNQGKFAKQVLKETAISKVIATDYDKNAVDKMYETTKEDNALVPFVYNFIQPVGKAYLEPIEERIQSDIVIALAITHHLILTQGVSAKDILTKLKSLTKKYIIVEFMPLGLYGGENATNPAIPEYYTEEWFKKEFELIFETMTIENLEKNRTVFVGKIK